jgi:hypothetical protein
VARTLAHNKARNAKYTKLAAAGGIYAAFALYLFQPYLHNFGELQYLLPLSVCLSSVGGYALSRRWVSTFTGSFFAGAVYGFGPFFLSLARFHPTAGLLAASIPWLFCPAAFIAISGTGRAAKAKRWFASFLSVLPFLVVILFFRVAAYYRLFPVPISNKVHAADLTGLIAPLVMVRRGIVPIGFYHVPAGLSVMAIAMFLKARRFGVIAVLCAGMVLAFCDSFLDVSPIIWLSIPALCCSILVGVGLQAMASAGRTDRKWLLLAAVLTGALSILTLLAATKYFQVFAGLAAGYARLLTQTAKMYILGAIAVGIIFFIARTNQRLSGLRMLVLSSALTVDLFYSARFAVDTIL